MQTNGAKTIRRQTSSAIARARRLALATTAAMWATLCPAAAETTGTANNTPDVLDTVAAYTRVCQWPDGAIQFKPEPPDKDVRSFIDHTGGMAENVARCYLYTGNPEHLKTMRKAIDFLRYGEPKHGQYFGGKSGAEVFQGMDAFGCWAQSFSIPIAWYYMLTGDKSIVIANHDILADAYDHHLEQFPFQNSTYNHERIVYWKGLIMARAMMKMAGDDARAAKYDKAIRLWRETFDYGWFEPHKMFTQWPFMEYDWNLERLKLKAYAVPYYMADTPKPDPFWALWEYAYTSSPNIYFDGWMLDETLHARILKSMRTLNTNLALTPDWRNLSKYCKDGEVGDWLIWYLLRFMHDAFVLGNGIPLYNDFVAFKGWPPDAAKGYEVSDLIPMADFAHCFFYVTPKFRFPIERDTHLGDVLVMADMQATPDMTAAPAAFYDAAIRHHDILHYGRTNPRGAMKTLAATDLDKYRVIIVANRYAGPELAAQAPRLLEWVEKKGGSLVLLDTGTETDGGLAWLPEALRLGVKRGVVASRDLDVPAELTTHPLLLRPNKLTSETLRASGKDTPAVFSGMAPGWEAVIVRASDRAPLLVQRRHGKGWICATTIDAAGAPTATSRPAQVYEQVSTTAAPVGVPPLTALIRNIMEAARKVSGEAGYDPTDPARAFQYPDTLPVLPHLQDIRFFDPAGVEIAYPFASNRTRPFTGPFTARFRLVSPVPKTPVSLIVPVWKGYAAEVRIDGAKQGGEPKQYMDLPAIVIETAATDNRVEVVYTPVAAR